MRPIVPLMLLLALPAHATRPDAPTVAKVPSIEEVVAAEGFTPTPSQSEIYKPGAVLVANGRGGHDVVVSNCIDVEPDIAIMSQSSIATTLAGGVSARIGVARGAASAGVEKRLSFVDPEQRTIALGDLVPSEDCRSKVERAGQLQDLSQAIVMHDVLVAIIKNTVCTKADASGGVVALGKAEAAAYSECVQESDGQVPLGYKAVSLDKVLRTNMTVPDAMSTDTRLSNPQNIRIRRMKIGLASVSGVGGLLFGAVAVAQQRSIKEGLQTGGISMTEAQDQMATANRNLVIGYTGLAAGVVVGGSLVWSARMQPGEATMSVGGTW